jgi:hypothetical protein
MADETGYRPINTKPTVLTEIVEAGSKVVEVNLEEDANGQVVAEEAPVAAVVAEPAPVLVVEDKEIRRKSRAKERIKEVLSERDAYAHQLAEERREKEELKKQLLHGSTQTKESFKQALEDQIKSLTAQMSAAMRDGQSDLVVALQDQLINAKMELKPLTTEILANRQELQKTESPKNQPVQQQNQIPEKALEWISDHPEFRSDEVFNAAAIATNNQLLREGFDPKTDEFYEEIDARLSKRFPELFGVVVQNSVQLSNKSASDGKQPDGKDQVVSVTPEVTSTKARTVEQVVSGSSRPSANTISKSRTTQVTLSAQDVKQAEAWGWSLERMARRIAHQEANRSENGYVPIHMN